MHNLLLPFKEIKASISWRLHCGDISFKKSGYRKIPGSVPASHDKRPTALPPSRPKRLPGKPARPHDSAAGPRRPGPQAATSAARGNGRKDRQMETAGMCYIFIAIAQRSSSISIMASFEIPFQIDTSVKISLSVPFASSSCNGTVILCSPASFCFPNRTWLPLSRIISYPNRLSTLISCSPLATGSFRNWMHLEL